MPLNSTGYLVHYGSTVSVEPCGDATIIVNISVMDAFIKWSLQLGMCDVLLTDGITTINIIFLC